MLAPFQIFGIAAALILLVDFGAIYTLSEAPHTGLTLAVDGPRIVVRSSNNSNISVGDRINGLRAAATQVDFIPSDLIEDPDLLPNRLALDTFFARQQLISNILSEPGASWISETGSYPVAQQESSFVGATTVGFWIQLLVGNIGFFVGLMVWSFQRNSVAARHFCVTGIGLAAAAISAAIYSSRSISLDETTFSLLSTTNVAGTLLFSAAFLSLMWHYPRALAKRSVAVFAYVAVPLILVLDQFPSMALDYTRRLPAVIVLLSSIVILILQWRRAKDDPLQRQSMKWFIFITLSGSSFFVLTILLPPLLGLNIVVPQSAAFIAFLSIYIGLAVGVSRYPLFDLDRYSKKAAYWALSGFLLVAIDLIFVTVFSVSERNALWLALAVSGWLYFPLRSLVVRYIFTSANSFEQQMPELIAAIARSDSEEKLARAWEEQLISIFNPLKFQPQDIEIKNPAVIKKGLSMMIPDIDGAGSYQLDHADQGKRLFTSADVELVVSLQRLLSLAHHASIAHDEGVLEERIRIKKDIHDSLGGRLLTILHRTKDPVIIGESRQAMNELRDILAAMEDQVSSLSSSIHRWQNQVSHQVDVFSVKLDWQVSEALQASDLSVEGNARLSIGRVITEATTNAIRHAKAKFIQVHFDSCDDNLLLSIENDGQCSDPAQWLAGNGLVNINGRAEDLGGKAKWSLTPDGNMQLHLVLPFGQKIRPIP